MSIYRVGRNTSYLLGIVFLFSLGFYSLSYFNQRDRILKNSFRDLLADSQSSRLAVYLIKEVDVFCRPCAKLEELRNQGVHLRFYVDKYYSDPDIVNFRESFGVSQEISIERMTQQALQAYKTCNRKTDEIPFNYLIVFSESGEIEEVRRF